MRIVFINPPFRGAYNREVRFQAVSPQKALHPPILLGYAAAVCEEDGHKVDLIDAPALEISREQTITRVKNFKPELIVMLTSTASAKSDGELAEELREKTSARTVAVGVHASSVPEEALESGFDMVARGEYEYTIKELANGTAKEKNLGISYKEKGKFVHNEKRPLIKDLDSLPFPARKFLPNEKYYSALYRNPFTFVLAGRGCPQQCIFCSIPQVMAGRAYRMRSVGNVIAELKELKKNYKFKSILFNDDTLNVNKKYVIELCDAMIREKINIPWGAYSRVDTVDEEIAAKMKEAGCFLVKVGFESGSDEMLRSMKKGPRATVEQARKAAKIFRDAGIQVHGTFVFGMPGETMETIRETIDFAKSLNIDFVQFSVAQPYPGTEFYEYLKKNNYLKFDSWDEYLDEEGCIIPIFEYPNLSREDMSTALRQAYREYYLRPSYIAHAIRQRLTNWNLFKTSLRSAWSLLHYIRG